MLMFVKLKDCIAFVYLNTFTQRVLIYQVEMILIVPFRKEYYFEVNNLFYTKMFIFIIFNFVSTNQFKIFR